MTRFTTVLATVLSLAFTPLAAQDYQKGWDAYNAGDYATALQEWAPLAEAGDTSFPILPISCHAFFEQTIFKGQIRYAFLQRQRL